MSRAALPASTSLSASSSRALYAVLALLHCTASAAACNAAGANTAKSTGNHWGTRPNPDAPVWKQSAHTGMSRTREGGRGAGTRGRASDGVDIGTGGGSGSGTGAGVDGTGVSAVRGLRLTSPCT